MTTESATPKSEVESTPAGLKKGAIGLFAVLFIAVANAAPITAMTGNTPIAIGYGNGIGAPAGFLIATIVLTLFAIGFVEMAKHITTAGAFYGFITHGLGQVWGMATGILATMAYVVFEGSLIGIFAYFANFGLEHRGRLGRQLARRSPIGIIAGQGLFRATSTSASTAPSSGVTLIARGPASR